MSSSQKVVARTRSVSPGKSPNKQGGESFIQYVTLNKELIKGLTETETENEHLKTVVIALNEKVTVIEDVRSDLADNKVSLSNSELSRKEL